MDNFISEIFFTSDSEYSFQRVGRYWNLYCKANGYDFEKEFQSFIAMQDYIREDRLMRENKLRRYYNA